MSLNVRRHHGHYAVFDGPDRVSTVFSSMAEAEARLLVIEAERARKARLRERPCLSCGTAFLSEGPHHRMCQRCRGRASALPPQMVG